MILGRANGVKSNSILCRHTFVPAYPTKVLLHHYHITTGLSRCQGVKVLHLYYIFVTKKIDTPVSLLEYRLYVKLCAGRVGIPVGAVPGAPYR